MRKLRRAFIIVAGVLATLILVVLIGGLMLPTEHHASRTLVMKQSPQAIWDAINDHAHEPQWRTDLANVVSLAEHDGKPVWQENYKDGDKLTLMTTESKPPQRWVREVIDLESPFSGRWEIDIASTAEGSKITITEIGKVPNPLFRFVARYIIGHTTSMERYLKQLAGRFGEPAQIHASVSRASKVIGAPM